MPRSEDGPGTCPLGVGIRARRICRKSQRRNELHGSVQRRPRGAGTWADSGLPSRLGPSEGLFAGKGDPPPLRLDLEHFDAHDLPDGHDLRWVLDEPIV